MTKFPLNTALIIVDVQNDFCPGGALAVPEGDAVIPVLNQLIPLFHTIIYTQDWHPENHCSFSDNPRFIDLSWPVHCVQNTVGAALHPHLNQVDNALFIHKGTDPTQEAYSGFQGTFLTAQLTERCITKLYIAGLATEYCVRDTALDARKAGFDAWLISDACRGINPRDSERTVKELKMRGVNITTSSAIIA